MHTLSEVQAKTIAIRENLGIEIPIMFVPPHIKKSQVVIPKNNELLIDDSMKNINDWNNNCGKGLLFTKEEQINNINSVNSLDFLLKLNR